MVGLPGGWRKNLPYLVGGRPKGIRILLAVYFCEILWLRNNRRGRVLTLGRIAGGRLRLLRTLEYSCYIKIIAPFPLPKLIMGARPKNQVIRMIIQL